MWSGMWLVAVCACISVQWFDWLLCSGRLLDILRGRGERGLQAFMESLEFYHPEQFTQLTGRQPTQRCSIMLGEYDWIHNHIQAYYSYYFLYVCELASFHSLLYHVERILIYCFLNTGSVNTVIVCETEYNILFFGVLVVYFCIFNMSSRHYLHTMHYVHTIYFRGMTAWKMNRLKLSEFMLKPKTFSQNWVILCLKQEQFYQRYISLCILKQIYQNYVDCEQIYQN